MPLTAADIKFFASAANTDNADGGGARSSTVVQNGVLNNLFPAVSAADRLTGRVSVRKIYPALTNADTAPLLGATVATNERPADAAVSLVMWATGDASTARAAAISGLNTLHTGSLTNAWFQPSSAVETAVLNFNRPFTSSLPPTVGQKLAVFRPGEYGNWPRAHRCTVQSVSAAVNPGGTGTPTFWQVGIDPPLPGSGFAWSGAAAVSSAVDTTPAYGTVALTASAASGQPIVVVNSTSAQLVPYTGSGAYPTADLGYPPAGLQYALGRVPVLREGDTVTVSDEQATASTTAAAGTPISTGRSNVDQIAIVGNDGVEIVRLLAGGPTSTLATANFSTGTITPTTVTGWSQPVTVRHRIAQRTTVASISGLNVTLATNLTATMPIGALVTSELPLGDVQARYTNVFTQQAWTRQWADTVIGNPAALVYNGDIGVTNQGAETDRYAVVFGDGLAFTVYSERLGLLGTGTTSAVFAPLNPATGAPLFTLLAANWATSVTVGTTLRFNTVAAAPPVWVARCVSPGATATAARAVLRVNGSV